MYIYSYLSCPWSRGAFANVKPFVVCYVVHMWHNRTRTIGHLNRIHALIRTGPTQFTESFQERLNCFLKILQEAISYESHCEVVIIPLSAARKTKNLTFFHVLIITSSIKDQWLSGLKKTKQTLMKIPDWKTYQSGQCSSTDQSVASSGPSSLVFPEVSASP